MFHREMNRLKDNFKNKLLLLKFHQYSIKRFSDKIDIEKTILVVASQSG